MLRLFRHIRQRLFLEGRVSRYLGYAVGEIVLIVVGILIALQINNWNDRRLDRIEEQEILARLLKEVQSHLAGFPQRFDSIEKKQKALKRVALAFDGQPIEDNKAFLSDVVMGTAYALWQPPRLRVTFEELQNSGKLGLVQNTSLREAIITYYNNLVNSEAYLDVKVGKYADISFDLIPSPSGATVRFDLELTESRYASLAQSILNSDLYLHITREENLANALYSKWSEIEERGIQLTAEIKAEIAN